MLNNSSDKDKKSIESIAFNEIYSFGDITGKFNLENVTSVPSGKETHHLFRNPKDNTQYGFIEKNPGKYVLFQIYN